MVFRYCVVSVLTPGYVGAVAGAEGVVPVPPSLPAPPVVGKLFALCLQGFPCLTRALVGTAGDVEAVAPGQPQVPAPLGGGKWCC